MIILGIESSCDETSIALVEDGYKVLSNVVSSQIKIHAKFGGVVPELAAREHINNIEIVLTQALQNAGKTLNDIASISVTQKPGLMPSLLVGVSFANGLALRMKKPLMGINHLHAHLYAVFLEKKLLKSNFPNIALLVSGGHTQLFHMKSLHDITLIGTTLDDASGEAFDKAAKLLKLPYPGGPIIDLLSKNGKKDFYPFPRALTKEGGKHISHENTYNFSFSGLKTSLYYYIKKNTLTKKNLPHITASYQEAIVDVLAKKTFNACKQYNVSNLIVAGGVACNSSLRERFQEESNKNSINLFLPEPRFCTDNAAMIAGFAFHSPPFNEKTLFLDAQSRCL